MMEGIYIVNKGEDIHTGFIVFYERGKLCVSKFTACSMPFIISHAAHRGVGGTFDEEKAQVFTCTLQ